MSALALLDGTVDAPSPTRDEADARSHAAGGLARWQRSRIEGFVAANLHQQIAIKDLAALVRLSPSYLCKVFKVTFGMSPHSYIMMKRVSRAKSAMVSTRAALSDIALSCGFSDQAHLCRVFRQAVGEAPHRWRQANQTDLGQ
ncbi:AraC-type DNA-binding protein [Methylobacterium sp. yr668]|nr:AraC-type DNA-binding protein [Methylobacterium sp. yr668]